MLSRRIFQSECLMAALRDVLLQPGETPVVLRAQDNERYPFLALMGGRSLEIFARQLDVVEKEGDWRDLAEGIVARLRRIHTMSPQEALTRADVNREVLAELSTILARAGHDAGEIDMTDDHAVLAAVQRCRNQLVDAAYKQPTVAEILNRAAPQVTILPSDPIPVRTENVC